MGLGWDGEKKVALPGFTLPSGTSMDEILVCP
jgi:hypothetical protein